MKLFISYSRDDKNFVYELAKRLNEEAQHDVWIDQRLTGAELWWDTILNSIEACDCFVYAMTPKSVGSIYCTGELEYALALNKPILPLMLKRCEMPAALRSIHYIDISNMSLLETLFQSVQALHRVEVALLKGGEWQMPSPPPPRPSVPKAKPGAPEHIYEAFAAAETAYADGDIQLAEDLYRNVIDADPNGLGKVATQRMGQLRTRADMMKAYASIQQLTANGLSEPAKLLWHNYVEQFGQEYDPDNFLTAFGLPEGVTLSPTPAQSSSGSAAQITETVTAKFSTSAESGQVPFEVKFTNESEGNINQYLWDFNDDGITDSIERNPTFTFYEVGAYNVTLTVVGHHGGTDSHTIIINAQKGDTTRYIQHLKTLALGDKAAPPPSIGREAQATHEPLQMGVHNDYLLGRMRLVEAGGFIFGYDEQRELPDFFIDVYPITNQDYYEFVKATGAKPPSHWNKGTFGVAIATHPVVNVSFEDAMDYCRWVGKRLPTAEEWEKAARGQHGQVYPWGDKLIQENCNSILSRRNTTTPVNHFLDGASPFGVFDMVGNVWEWTLDEERTRGFPRRTKRVIKGGSFKSNEGSLRCSEFVSTLPNHEHEDIGFRCVWSP